VKKILLHCCCAPCSTASIERLLADGYEIVLFYSNSNIYPKEEFGKRFSYMQKLSEIYKLELIADEYDHNAWSSAVKGLEDEPEKGRRCAACFAYNLARAEAKARELGIEEFTTTLTVSPHKISQMIFDVAKDMAGYVPYNFKKQEGFKKSLQLSEKYGLYRQNYCGCEYSLRSHAEATPAQ